MVMLCALMRSFFLLEHRKVQVLHDNIAGDTKDMEELCVRRLFFAGFATRIAVLFHLFGAAFLA